MEEKKKNITFNDIAKYTGFSKTTISRYFNNPDSLTLKNQQIITESLDKLGYKKNKVAKILANGRTEFIGVIIPDFYHHFYSEVLNHILDTYDLYGYKFMVFNGKKHEKDERRYIDELMAYKIEGLIIMSHTIPSIELSALPIPVVTVEREDKYISSVNTDNYAGAVQAVDLLIENQCDILIHINSSSHIPNNMPATERIRGFQETCEKHAVPYEILFMELVDSSHASAYASLKPILEKIEKEYSGKRKGIFLSSDNYANVFLNLLVRKYGKLPEDYRIVGFDNSAIAIESVYELSTIGQQTELLAKEAMAILVSQMEELHKRQPNPVREPMHKVIPPVLIRRETTK